MMFLIRAGLWLAVTALFVPPGFTADGAAWTEPLRAEIARLAPSAPDVETGGPYAVSPQAAPARHSADARSGFCLERREVCAVAAEALRFGAFLGDAAVYRIERWLAAEVPGPEAAADDPVSRSV